MPSDWRLFFAPLPQNTILVNLLPPFTQPGNATARVAAFIRYFQSFFGVQSVTPNILTATSTTPPSLNPPASDVIGATIAAYPGFALGNPLVMTTLQLAAQTALPGGDPQAWAWAVQTVSTLNQLYILANGSVPPNLLFSVMEALYARGFTSVEDVLELPSEDFQQALTGTVAYDFAAAIYIHASTLGTPHKCPPFGPQAFTPINPGSLTDCVPPPYLSPLGPIAYLQEMLKVSERSTCDVPFPAALPDVQGQSLATVVAQRRGPIDTTLLATRANLETPLPLIDIVNECLEYAASTKPPGKHGTVYNTAEDVLAGHKLCVEECCTEQEKNHEAACHDPATLFAALPEYSTPGILASPPLAKPLLDVLVLSLSLSAPRSLRHVSSFTSAGSFWWYPLAFAGNAEVRDLSGRRSGGPTTPIRPRRRRHAVSAQR